MLIRGAMSQSTASNSHSGPFEQGANDRPGQTEHSIGEDRMPSHRLQTKTELCYPLAVNLSRLLWTLNSFGAIRQFGLN